MFVTPSMCSKGRVYSIHNFVTKMLNLVALRYIYIYACMIPYLHMLMTYVHRNEPISLFLSCNIFSVCTGVKSQ